MNTRLASMSTNAKSELDELLLEFADIFPSKLPGLPPKRKVTHSIDTENASPVAQRSYQMSP